MILKCFQINSDEAVYPLITATTTFRFRDVLFWFSISYRSFIYFIFYVNKLKCNMLQQISIIHCLIFYFNNMKYFFINNHTQPLL